MIYYGKCIRDNICLIDNCIEYDNSFLALVAIALILASFKYIFKQDNKYEAKKEV